MRCEGLEILLTGRVLEGRRGRKGDREGKMRGVGETASFGHYFTWAWYKQSEWKQQKTTGYENN
jgi:hypothetical protein